ncbi:putative signal peptide protein [Puccinia sorghi]|uniref:Putative signal peptide protein n=1 Tax=Puccinia sorghi TaxID=27349 RepID=A0A0L6UA64_9BASI|nr:putative signal peptide protein [Puccinia sorghi]
MFGQIACALEAAFESATMVFLIFNSFLTHSHAAVINFFLIKKSLASLHELVPRGELFFGVRLIYLPEYLPELNPIEVFFSQIEQILPK